MDALVAYGVQRGRRRALRRVLDELQALLEDPMATEDQLAAWRDQLRAELDQIESHVDELEHATSLEDALEQGGRVGPP